MYKSHNNVKNLQSCETILLAVQVHMWPAGNRLDMPGLELIPSAW